MNVIRYLMIMNLIIICQPWKALRLGNNSIASISIFEVVQSFTDPEKVMWLDLSFNLIDRIDESLPAIFPNLTTLYLHANHITKLSHIKKLASLTKLKSLTLYGNPVEEHKHYRNYILYCFPHLQQLDFCVITSNQREKVSLSLTRDVYICLCTHVV